MSELYRPDPLLVREFASLELYRYWLRGRVKHAQLLRDRAMYAADLERSAGDWAIANATARNVTCDLLTTPACMVWWCGQWELANLDLHLGGVQ